MGRDAPCGAPHHEVFLGATSISKDEVSTLNAGAYLYVLRCADGSYYVGTTRKSLDERLGEHNAGLYSGYTATRRPVAVIFAQYFDTISDAVAAERQVKGWSRAKKEALIAGN